MADLRSYKVGQLIQLNDGRQGIIRFLGQTAFAPGDWVGIEFEDASGKNDGSVQGNRYFDCEMGHGMFLKPTGVAKVLESPTPKPRTRPAPGAQSGTSGTDKKNSPKGRTSRLSTTSATVNGVARKPAVDPTANRRATLNSASPTPAPKPKSTLNGLKSPPKVAARAVGSTATSSAASSRGNTPTTSRQPLSRPGPAPRTSLAASATVSKPTSATSRTQRSSLAPKQPTKPSTATGRAPSSRLSSQISPSKPRTAPNGVKAAPEKDDDPLLPPRSNDGDASESEPQEIDQSKQDSSFDENPEDHESINGEQKDVKQPEPLRKPPPSKEKTQPATMATTTLNKKVEEYEAKIKLLEKKRSEDVERLATLEKIQTEKERIERIVQTLQGKLKPQSQELATARSRVKELEEQIDQNESKLAEHESEMEMATLDREMAEETAETLRLELDALREKQEELELEVEVLREENAELGKETSPEERATQGWLKLERHNDRLREALMRLRDISQSTEADLKERVAALEEDLKQLEDVQTQYDETKQKLSESDAAIEDLKQQLEAALASEDMVEELAETNNDLSEQNRKLRVEIDELQTMNELNEEFETQRIENERLMQEEIDTRGAALVEQTNRTAKQDEKLAEYEYTISKFREVVNSLQSHIEDLKTSQQISDAEADELNARSKAMTDLNMKLQSSAAKAQNTTVDVEMRRLEAQEAADHLAVVLEFLPDGFQPERDSVQVYLRFKRVAFKSRLLYDLFKDRLSGNVSNVPAEVIFISFSIIDKLTWISCTCDRFVSDISGCSPDRFGKYEQAFHELDPVERGLDGYVESWKKQDIRERQMDEDLRRSMAVLTHLSEVYIKSDLATFADETLMRTNLMLNHLETTGSVLVYTKSLVERHIPEDEGQDEAAGGDMRGLLQQIDGSISLSRSAKITSSKTLTTIRELKERSMALNQDCEETFSETLSKVASTTSYAMTLGTNLLHALDDPGISDTPFETRVRTAMTEFRTACFPDSPTSADPLETFNAYLKRMSTEVKSLQAMTKDLSLASEFTRNTAPWIMRAEALRAASQSNSAAEAEVQRLKDLLNERSSALRSKDQSIEEQHVKIELLEARMRDANTKAKRVEELQGHINMAKQRERQLLEEIDKKYKEMSTLKQERDQWKATVDSHQLAEDTTTTRGDKRRSLLSDKMSVSGKEINVLRLEIKGLQDAVKYLRNDSPQTTTIDQMAWLQEPLLPTKSRREDKKKQENMIREGADIWRSLLSLTTTAKPVDLSALPANKLSWRPAREKSSWKVACQVEEWELWLGQKDAFVERAKDYLGTPPPHNPSKVKAV